MFNGGLDHIRTKCLICSIISCLLVCTSLLLLAIPVYFAGYQPRETFNSLLDNTTCVITNANVSQLCYNAKTGYYQCGSNGGWVVTVSVYYQLINSKTMINSSFNEIYNSLQDAEDALEQYRNEKEINCYYVADQSNVLTNPEDANSYYIAAMFFFALTICITAVGIICCIYTEIEICCIKFKIQEKIKNIFKTKEKPSSNIEEVI